MVLDDISDNDDKKRGTWASKNLILTPTSPAGSTVSGLFNPGRQLSSRVLAISFEINICGCQIVYKLFEKRCVLVR
jgi:hypothetical protein